MHIPKRVLYVMTVESVLLFRIAQLLTNSIRSRYLFNRCGGIIPS